MSRTKDLLITIGVSIAVGGLVAIIFKIAKEILK